MIHSESLSATPDASSFSTVYYIGDDLKRHPYIDAQTFFTWQESFDLVKSVTDATLSTLIIGSQVLPKLRWIISEESAIELYGSGWSEYVIDIQPTLFSKFAIGDDIGSGVGMTVNMSGMKTRVGLNS